jgi:hypothetical protein
MSYSNIYQDNLVKSRNKAGIVASLMIKSRRMKWAGHVAGMAEKRNAYRPLIYCLL